MSQPKLNIVFISINYFPEDSAIGLYNTQWAGFLKSQGHHVEILSGFPYYPYWKIFDSYKSFPVFYKENINGITVKRYKQYVPKAPNFIRRIIHMLDYFAGSCINAFKVKKADVVIVIVPFTINILTARIIRWRTGA